MYNWSPKQTFDKIQYNAMGNWVITNMKNTW